MVGCPLLGGGRSTLEHILDIDELLLSDYWPQRIARAASAAVQCVAVRIFQPERNHVIMERTSATIHLIGCADGAGGANEASRQHRVPDHIQGVGGYGGYVQFTSLLKYAFPGGSASSMCSAGRNMTPTQPTMVSVLLSTATQKFFLSREATYSW